MDTTGKIAASNTVNNNWYRNKFIRGPVHFQ